MFIMGFAEELWKRFVPKYLETLGAPITAIGAYGTVRDLADGLFQYPGGWLADHYGRRRALTICLALALAGYLTYLIAPSWPVVFVGLPLVMAWASGASPTLFAVVGDALPKERRTMGFTVQAVLKRIPIVIAPSIGGWMIARMGIVSGMHTGLIVGIALCAGAIVIVQRVDFPTVQHTEVHRIAGVWKSLPGPLRSLLASDILVRLCEGLADVFIVIYAIDVIGVSAPQFGLLVAIQTATAIASYAPAAALGSRTGRKPFVIATFLAFAAFPLLIAISTGFWSLVVAFVVGGLREIGEPSRKALIVDFAQPHLRARTVGIYYLIRGIAVSPAALIGGLLWRVQPSLAFVVAFAIGLIGTLVFAVTVRTADAA